MTRCEAYTRAALRTLLLESVDWQAALGKGDRPSLDRAIAQARAALRSTSSASPLKIKPLKRCPFDKAPAQLEDVPGRARLPWRVVCSKCQASTSFFALAPNAVNAWNRRAR